MCQEEFTAKRNNEICYTSDYRGEAKRLRRRGNTFQKDFES